LRLKQITAENLHLIGEIERIFYVP
jgi:hypothetical protein